MKIRSFLLVACIVVVPLIAMFSHRLPPGARAAVVGLVRDLAGSPAAHARAVAPQAAQQAAPVRPEATPPAAASAAVPPRVVPVSTAVPEAAAFGPLRALGAVALDCRPLDARGGHVATCRVPVDGNGQLERVFRATGADAAAAADNLLRDVTAWRHGAVEPRRGTMRF